MDPLRPPAVADALMRAAQSKDRSRLLTLFRCDSLIVDSGCEYRADAIVDWASRLFQDCELIQPINVRRLEGHSTITLTLKKRTHEEGRPAIMQVDWQISAVGEKIASLTVTASAPLSLPLPVARFVDATNTFDLDRFVETFADDAVVNDQLHEYRGKAQIRSWASREIVGVRLTIYARQTTVRHESATMSAVVGGDFDKRGLPDPLVLDFYFTTHDDKIVQLIMLRNEPNSEVAIDI